MTTKSRNDEAREVTINTAQIEAMFRMLIDSGDMTPTAERILRKLWEHDGD